MITRTNMIMLMSIIITTMRTIIVMNTTIIMERERMTMARVPHAPTRQV